MPDGDVLAHSPMYLPSAPAEVGSHPGCQAASRQRTGNQPVHDAAFKRLFCHPVAIEILVREYAPKRAERIDFSTLEKLDAELVGEALVRRYPDMIWMARTRDGAGHVVILMEFQGARDRLMSLRVAVYALLTVQELLRRMRLSRTPHSLEVLSFVIYHGKGRWTAPTRLGGLFSHWVPGDYRVIPRQSDQGGSGTTRDDLSRAILALERDRSVEGTRATLRALNADCRGDWR